MPVVRTFSEIWLVNGSTGDPALFIDYPGRHNALLFDAGENGRLDAGRLSGLEAVFLTHHHMDHFVGFDRILRANLDQDKTLHVYGPVKTIERVYARLKSYDHAFFPFQKLVLRVHEILDGRLRSADLECARKFPKPDIVETAWKRPVVYENEDLTVEATPVDHTVPCLAFALVEKTGYHPDPAKLAGGVLRPGPWIGEVLRLLRARAAPNRTLDIQGGQFTLATLRDQYFTRSRGGRVAYVTDTAWSDRVKPALVKLAHRAVRLYCDCFYRSDQSSRAQLYRHMTAPQAAEFAKLARVEELVLMHFASRYAGRYEVLLNEARALFPRTTADLGA
jgi:ribonuclease Z